MGYIYGKLNDILHIYIMERVNCYYYQWTHYDHYVNSVLASEALADVVFG